MVDGEVRIPIKFTVEDDNSVKEHVEGLQKRLQSLEVTKKSSKVSMDESKEIQNSIDAVNKYIEAIEKARDKMSELKDIVARRSDVAADISTQYNNSEEGSKERNDLYSAMTRANAQLARAQDNLIVQGTELKLIMNDAADAAERELAAVEHLVVATENVKPKVDLLKQAMADYNKEAARVNQENFEKKYNLPTIEKQIAQIKEAMRIADNALDVQVKNAAGQKVTVSHDATEELQEQYEWLTAWYTSLETGLEYFTKFQQQVTDGSVVQALAEAGQTTEKWTLDIVNLATECDHAASEIVKVASAYEHEARIAAGGITEMQGKNVVSADRSNIGYAETSVKMTEEQKKALEEEKRLLEEEKKAQEEAAKAAEIAAKEKEKAEKRAAAAAKKFVQDRIKEYNREIAEINRSASAYYYKLRAMKMLGFVVSSLNGKVKTLGKNMVKAATAGINAYLKLIPGVNALRRAFDKTHASQKKFNSEMKKSNRTTKLNNATLGQLLKTLLKYGLGIRSIFVLFNKLRRAVGEGLESMAIQFDHVNEKMSSIVTSLNTMKAAVTTVVQPLLKVIAPLLEHISELLTDVTYKVASFIAALTGQSTVLRAIKYQVDYAESLDKTAKSAKNAAKELGKYDKLNVISKDKDDGTGDLRWEEVPIDDTLADWAKKFKNFFDELFAPLKAAWEKYGKYVMNAWKIALGEVKALAEDVFDTFMRVWKEDKTQKIFENILVTIGHIGLVVANLAKNLKDAWDVNENGYRIFASIRDIILIISEGLRECAWYTVEWSDKLTFVPLLDAIANVLEKQIVPAVEKIKDLFVYLYKEVLLEIVRYVTEELAPVFVRAFGNLVEAIGNIAENLRKALEEGDKGKEIMEKFEGIIDIIAKGIEDCSKKTAEWAKNLDFTNLLDHISQFLDDITPAVQFVVDLFTKFYEDVLLPFWKYLIEGGKEGKGGLPGTLEKIGKVVQEADWESITANMEKFMDALEPFLELAWDTLSQLIGDLLDKILDFAGSEEFSNMIDKFKEWISDADPEELAGKIEKLTTSMIGLIAGLTLMSKIVIPAVTGWMTFWNAVGMGIRDKKIAELTAEIAKLNGTEASPTGLAALKANLANAGGELKTFGAVMKDFGTVMTGPETKLGQFIAKLEPLAKPGGVLLILVGIFQSLTGGMDMMTNGFSLGSEAITVFGGVLVTVGAILLGVAAWPATIAGAIVVLIANLGAFGDDLLNWVLTTANDITDKIGEFFHNIGFYLGAWIHEAIEKLGSLLKEGLDYMSKPENWAEFGLNILKGILAIFLLPFKLIEWIGSAIANLFSGFIEGLCTGFDMHSPSKKMEPYGENILKGLLEGMLSIIKTIGTWAKTKIVDPILKAITAPFKIVGSVSQALLSIGKYVINGLKSGLTLSEIWSNIKSAITSKLTSVINNFKNKLSSNTLVSIGKNLIAGLKNGISDALSGLLSTVSNVCNDVIDTFKDIFNIASPSKETKKIGEFVTEGFEDGMKDGANDMDKVFSQTFLGSLTDMKVQALDIVTSMTSEIENVMNNMQFLNNFNSQLNSISSIKVPDIAIGNVLPATASFKTSNSASDDKKLKEAIQEAVAEALSAIDFNSNKEPIMLQLDKRTVAEAVWDETDKRYKQRGVSSTLYR